MERTKPKLFFARRNTSLHSESERAKAWCLITSDNSNISGGRHYLSKQEEGIWLKPSLPPTHFTQEPLIVEMANSYEPINQVISITKNKTKTQNNQISVTIKRKDEDFRVLVEKELLSPRRNNNQVTVIFGRKLNIWIGRYCITLRNCKEEGNIPQEVLEKYHLIADLAESTSSTVYKIQDKNNRDLAALKVERSTGSRDSGMVNEIAILSKLSHENIISIISADTNPLKHHLITPFAIGGDLMLFPCMNMVQTTENQANRVFRQVISAIAYLHQNRITHRDIKPENILLMDNSLDRVKITDFRSSCIIPASGYMNAACGTLSYMSPIVMDNHLHDLKRPYTKKTDIWSLGVCMYVFLLGELPFLKSVHDDEVYYQRIKENMYTMDPASVKRLSEPLQTILLDCLEFIESSRPIAEDLLKYYAWFSDSFKFDTDIFRCSNCEKLFETQVSLFNHQYDCGGIPWM